MRNLPVRLTAVVLAGGVVSFVCCPVSAVELDPVPAKPAAALPADQLRLVFTAPGASGVVTRTVESVRSLAEAKAAPTARAEGIVRALVAGPTEAERASGIASALPCGTALGKVAFPKPDSVTVCLDIPDAPKSINPRVVETAARQFDLSLHDEGIRQFTLMAKDPATGEYKSLRAFLPAPKTFAPEADPDPDHVPVSQLPEMTVAPPAPPNGQISGALTGKGIIFNQGHGWLDDTSGWRVQREKLLEQLEDYSTNEFISMYVVPLMQNAGAKVQSVRELDMQTNMVIVDNADAAYAETGTGWSVSTANGFVNKSGASWTGTSVNPFGNASATRYNTSVVGSATATATYTPNVPAAGYYNVYISFSKGSNRVTDAHWQVYHTGGVTDFRINEQRDGATWLLLGNFYFNAGSNPSTGKIVVLNDSATASAIVSCDAVRLGGGMGDVARRTHGVSGKTRWQEEAMNYLNYLGCYVSGGPIYTDDTVTYDDEQLGWGDRPAYASWEQSRDSEGANTIYIGYHTNAYDGGCSGGSEVEGTARGTNTYRDVDADATAATIALAAACHNAVVDNVQSCYDSTWQDRGVTGSNGYGECSQANLGSVAGFFFESLFADNSADNNPYKDPKFRYIFARGVQQGVISYFGGTTFPPEPPTNFRVRNLGGGQVRLDWTAGPVRTASIPYGSAATSYRVFTSTNGYGFDNGVNTAGAVTNYTFTLTPGQLVYFRVCAVNAAGISIPTETLGSRVNAGAGAQALVVNGSHRYDRYIPRLVTAVAGCSDSNVRKMDWRNFQSFNYVIQHGTALSNYAVGFDSCSAECVEAGQVTLTAYQMIDWIGAQEAEAEAEPSPGTTDDSAIKPNSRAALQTYLAAGGKLFISNAEMAWEFNSDTTKKAFLNSYMKANYVADSPGTGVYTATGVAGSIFAGVSSFTFDNGTGSTYQVRLPDVISPNGTGVTACLNYVGGTSNNSAGIQYSGTFGSGTATGKLVYLGFGFETIVSDTVRNTIMGNTLTYFGVTGTEDWQMY